LVRTSYTYDCTDSSPASYYGSTSLATCSASASTSGMRAARLKARARGRKLVERRDFMFYSTGPRVSWRSSSQHRRFTRARGKFLRPAVKARSTTRRTAVPAAHPRSTFPSGWLRVKGLCWRTTTAIDSATEQMERRVTGERPTCTDGAVPGGGLRYRGASSHGTSRPRERYEKTAREIVIWPASR
jgi:hypothetical protein